MLVFFSAWVCHHGWLGIILEFLSIMSKYILTAAEFQVRQTGSEVDAVIKASLLLTVIKAGLAYFEVINIAAQKYLIDSIIQQLSNHVSIQELHSCRLWHARREDCYDASMKEC